MSEWINIKEKLPPIHKQVIFLIKFNGRKMIFQGYLHDHTDISITLSSCPFDLGDFVTHWMEYPELPED